MGNDASTWQGTIGCFWPGEQNENGVRLVDSCAPNRLVITNTLFQQRPVTSTRGHPSESSLSCS